MILAHTDNQPPPVSETGSDAVSRPTEVQSDDRQGACLFLQMPFHFCPQCGTKLQPGFKFCPSCGERLPCPEDQPAAAGVTAASGLSSPEKDERAAARTSWDSAPVHRLTEGKSDSFYDAFVFSVPRIVCVYRPQENTDFVSQAKLLPHRVKLQLVLRCKRPETLSAWQSWTLRPPQPPVSPPVLLPEETRMTVTKTGN